MSATCPAVFIAAPASGQGKTTVTAALARYHRDQGRAVRVFKMGPDFLDPMILEQACGHPVDPLHLWMVGEEDCRAMLHGAAETADLILVEGSMGLFDGDPSGADLAVRFGLPVLGLIDASGMAQTFGAVVNGLATWRPDLPFAGVIANRVGSAGHGRMLGAALPEGIRYFGAVPRNEAVGLPDRHLGLVQAEEIDDLEQRLAAAANAVAEAEVTGLPEPVAFEPGSLPEPEAELGGVRIAIARDAAFAFLYPGNLRLLEAMGAELVFFSPLAGEGLPEADAVWLPGGYPELHLDTLTANQALKADLHAHHQAGRPILAECGGFLYLLDTLADAQGHRAPMAGLLPGEAQLEERVQGIGLQAAPLPEGEIRGHTFHHSRAEVNLEPVAHCIRARNRGSTAEAIYRQGRLTATYLHAWFPSNPSAVAELFKP
ncbi:cobyrinic acid a,c-diamide synthase [Thiohalorhabdus denitrificans]|uniref:Hydrogenobyrinic acid a,c-diamide synthase (Glutamine-hydrolysing) n=1 Tax=Thiohalorhabdus denitrificans TaxID=381306 RepID=A0A0P9GGC4_9GAMM|nr:cobyrinate a,c-diamide synthase [Thiohalorhabdus denitrificans]KPV39071.1 cobyrinic acid a,c-diamide synthase [Thiohalorhabdus denitrificans]SCX78367.1 hydrogenobyrinic acid a,c-diamide synthase (glutamine-hydrolysing) [Thiohalorhabdus denitrificans]